MRRHLLLLSLGVLLLAPFAAQAKPNPPGLVEQTRPPLPPGLIGHTPPGLAGRTPPPPLAVVPEPGTLVLLATGAAGLAAVRKYRARGK